MDRKFLWAAFFLSLIVSIFVARAVILDMKNRAGSMDAEMAKSPLGELWFKSLELEKEASRKLKASDPAGAVAALDGALENISRIKTGDPRFFPQWVEERGNSLRELRQLIEMVKTIPAQGENPPETEAAPLAFAKKLPNQPERPPLNLKPPTGAHNSQTPKDQPVTSKAIKQDAPVTEEAKTPAPKQVVVSPKDSKSPTDSPVATAVATTPPTAPAVKTPPVAPAIAKTPPPAPAAIKTPPPAPAAVKTPPTAPATVKTTPPTTTVAANTLPTAPPTAPATEKKLPIAPSAARIPPTVTSAVEMTPPPVASAAFKIEDLGKDPSSIWYRAMAAVREAEKFNASGQFDLAIRKYEESKMCYEVLNRDFPEFQSQHIKNGPKLLEQKLKEIKAKK